MTVRVRAGANVRLAPTLRPSRLRARISLTLAANLDRVHPEIAAYSFQEEALAAASSITGLVSAPMRSISIVTLSPAFK